MKKFLKIFGIVVLAVWLITTTFITYVFFRNSWREFLIEDAKSMMPYLIYDEPITIEDGELILDEYFNETPFIDRIENIEDGFLMDVIMYSEGMLDLYEPTFETSQVLLRFKDYYDDWPKQLRKYCDQYIYKVLIVSNLGSNGRAISLNESSAFVLLIDEEVLQKTPNVWATEDESKVFAPDAKGRTLNVIIENNDDPTLTFENVLIHEIGHAFGVTHGLTPDFRMKIPMENKYPFFDETFTKYVVDFDRKAEHDYLYDRVNYSLPNPELDFNSYIELLGQLDQTSFPTMYASRNPLELFAEVFYSHIHCNIQNRPFRYELVNNNEIIETFQNGINEPRCAYELNFIKEYFEN